MCMTGFEEDNHIDEYSVEQETCPNCGGEAETETNGDRIYVLHDGYTTCEDCSVKWHVEDDVVDEPLNG